MRVENRKECRTPLRGDHSLTFLDVNQRPYERKVHIERVIGQGNSCICYAVRADFGENNTHKMILKQFYPDPVANAAEIKTDGISMEIAEFEQREDMKYLAELFEQSYELQNDLANTEELMDMIVRPYEKYFDGATKYILYEANYGDSLEKCRITDVEEMLRLTVKLASALHRLHERGILHMDLKPENILWTGHKNVKFFDFDSAVRMDQISQVHSIRGDMYRIELLAPELRDLSEFEQNKRVLLKPRVDIYSAGAMLFHWFLGRYPGEADCNDFSCEGELRSVYERQYRGKFTRAEQDRLNHIIRRSISSSVGRRGRYQSARELADELQIVLASAAYEKGGKKAQGRKVNYSILAAYLLSNYPLYPYGYKDASGTRILDVAIIGQSAMREAFLKHIFACGQMLDTRLKIRLLSKDALQYMEVLKLAWPQLSGTVQLFRNEERIRGEMDPAITKEPLAELYFYDDGFDACRYQDVLQHTRYFLLAGDDWEKNYRDAEKLAEWILSQDTFSDGRRISDSGVAKKIFIGYGDDRGDGYDLRSMPSPDERLTLAPFGCNARYSIAEKDFKKGIGKQAFRLHCYYAGAWHPQATKKQLWKDFTADPYNIRSSMRSALALPYKFVSIGLDPDTDGAEAFREAVLSDEREAKERLNLLIYLEHRSWLCFMIIEGYRKPTFQELRKYAFSGRNDQRDKNHKLHPCMCDCSPADGVVLGSLSHQEWDRITQAGLDSQRRGINIWEKKASDGSQKAPIIKDFDALDRMSLMLHQICEEKTGLLDLSSQFVKLKWELSLEEADDACFEILCQMQMAYEKMLRAENGANHLWTEVCAEFQEKLDEMERTKGLFDDEIKDAFTMIQEDMRVVWERNLYHDYKKSDLTSIQAIPELIL